MKIAIISPEIFPIPPIKGGAVETWIYKVAKELCDVELNILSIHSDTLPLENKEGNINYFRYKRLWLDELLLASYKFPTKNSRSFFYWYFYSSWCAKICRHAKPGIIHIHNRWQFVPVVRKLNPNSKIVLHFHQLSALNFLPTQAIHLKERINTYIACSDFIKEEIKKRFGVKDESVSVVRNGVDFSDFKPVSEQEKKDLKARWGFGEDRIVLYSGRLAENKGCDVLIKAFLDLKPEKTKLVIAGGATYSDVSRTDYTKLLERLRGDQKERIIFLGYIPHQKMPELYKAADVFVLPSQVEEALGMSLIEAMATGLAVIGSDRGGIKELIEDGVTGFLVRDCSNPMAFSDKLKILLGRVDLASDMGRKALEKVEKDYSWESVSQMLESVYTHVLKEKN